MRPNSSSAFFVSLLLHAGIVAVVIAVTYVAARQDKEMPQIIELVAGPRTNDGPSLEAPALGNTPDPVKVDTAPRADPTPPSEPEPVVKTEPVEATPTPPAEKPQPKVVEKPKAVEKPKPVEKAKPKVDTSMAKEMNKTAKTSYKEYLKKHPIPKQTASSGATRKTATGPRVDATGIANGIKGGSAKSRSGEGGKALTREEADQMSTYISLLIQELKKAHEPPPGVSDRLETKVTFDITASGAILNPRISKSSGDKEFDVSVLEAFLRMRSIGPTPNRRADTWTVTFRMRDEA